MNTRHLPISRENKDDIPKEKSWRPLYIFLYSLSPPLCIYPDPCGKGSHSRKVQQASWASGFEGQTTSIRIFPVWNLDLYNLHSFLSFLPFWILNLINPLQPWIFIGRTDAEDPILWLPDVKSQLSVKDPDAGKDWGQEKGTTEDEMVWPHHWLNGYEFEQTSVDSGLSRWC